MNKWEIEFELCSSYPGPGRSDYKGIVTCDIVKYMKYEENWYRVYRDIEEQINLAESKEEVEKIINSSIDNKNIVLWNINK